MNYNTEKKMAHFVGALSLTNPFKLNNLILSWYCDKESPLFPILHNRILSGNELHFSRSIFWIMLVLDKIESLGFRSKVEKPVGGQYICEISSLKKGVNIRVSDSDRVKAIYKACNRFLTEVKL